MRYFLGVDIGGTKCAVCLGDDAGTIIDRIAFATNERQGPQQAIDNLIRSAQQLIDKHRPKLSGIGISCGSPLDPERGVIQAPANLPSWVDVPIVKIFSERFAVPAFLENDANAGAIAEHAFGAGRGCQHMIFCTMGTGMGAGLILNGRIYRGANVYAGEIGHIRLERFGPVGCRKAGSFEGFCSGGGIAQLAAMERGQWQGATCLPERPTAKDVGEGATQGDALSLKILDQVGHYLGVGLAYVLDIINPERVVIGSIFARCERFLRPAMQRALEAEALPQTVRACTIVPAQLGEQIGDFAAIAVAVDQVQHAAAAR
ncbi:MAG: ROK family protein [Planctomycetes bacterium]|nr:ROK family protein [Planctomycetota bacterium]